MPKIKQLSAHEAQKIAAGEVVERPANIVKELIENSLDAGATAITIMVEDGGKKLLRIIDNGCGMDVQDAHMCFVKHATSKVECIEDVTHVQTHGFRGEALASVAAVGRVTLLTKEATALEGIKLEVENSIIISESIAPHTTGTDISVKDLFFNIPARQKFLKSRDTEWRHVLQLVTAFCLDYPDIHFKLFSESKQILNCPPVHSLHERCEQIFDTTASRQLLAITATKDNQRITIEGIISHHQILRYDRNDLYFFVNKRWVKNHKLGTALIKGYKNLLPASRYPVAAIAITIDPALVDINIHPRKEEIKFLHPRIIESLIEQAVSEGLAQKTSSDIAPAIAEAPVSYSSSYSVFKPFNFDMFAQQSAQSYNSYAPIANVMPTHANTSSPIGDTAPLSFFEPETVPLQKSQPLDVQQSMHTVQECADYRLIGQFNNTYLLIEQKDGLYLVDQHAAHERILYELFAKRFHDVATINLLFPDLISLSEDDVTLITPHLALFQQHGIMVEQFNENQLIVESTPIHLKNISCNELIREMIAVIKEYEHIHEEEFFKAVTEKLRAQMACKAAVKAGDTLSQEQMTQLLKDLYQTENRFACPHGRPTGFLLSTYEIEKKFKRKL